MPPPLATRTRPPRQTAGSRRELPHRRGAWARLESWLWTGPLGHFAGGVMDFAEALARYWVARLRRAL